MFFFPLSEKKGHLGILLLDLCSVEERFRVSLLVFNNHRSSPPSTTIIRTLTTRLSVLRSL